MDILKLEMSENCDVAKTVGEYLTKLLLEVLTEGESFNGKRPFGNSGWEYELAYPLVKAGLVEGEYDSDDDEVYDVEWCQFYEILERAIRDKLM